MRPRLAASALRSERSGEKQNDLNARASKSFDPGPDLFSRGPTSRVSSALAGLTAVFGMGTGVTPPLQGPRMTVYQARCLERKRRRRAPFAVTLASHGQSKGPPCLGAPFISK